MLPLNKYLTPAPVVIVLVGNPSPCAISVYVSILSETVIVGNVDVLNIIGDVLPLFLSTFIVSVHLTFGTFWNCFGIGLPFKSNFAVPTIVIVASPFGVLFTPLSWYINIDIILPLSSSIKSGISKNISLPFESLTSTNICEPSTKFVELPFILKRFLPFCNIWGTSETLKYFGENCDSSSINTFSSDKFGLFSFLRVNDIYAPCITP